MATRYGKQRTTPVYAAVSGGNVNILKLLLSFGAKVDVHDTIRRTPLHAACEHGDLDIVDLLLENLPATSKGVHDLTDAMKTPFYHFSTALSTRILYILCLPISSSMQSITL